MNDLVARKKHLLKEMHLLESKLGNSKARDLLLHKDPYEDVQIVPKNSSYFDKSLKVQQIQEELHRKTFEDECFKSQNTKKNQSPRATATDLVHSQSLSDISSPCKVFGGNSTTTKDSYINFHKNNKYITNNTNNTIQSIGIRNNSTCPRFEANMNDYNNIIIQQNKLVQPPRNARKTLMLSNLGFQSHCSDIALEIVEILRQRNI